METAFKVLGLLPWTDWAAVAVLFLGWIGYAVFAKRRSTLQPSLLDTTNHIRRHWMLQSTYREVRVVDGIVIQSLSSSPSFFASTTILIIGGLLAVLGTTKKASELVREIPFAARTSVPAGREREYLERAAAKFGATLHVGDLAVPGRHVHDPEKLAHLVQGLYEEE